MTQFPFKPLEAKIKDVPPRRNLLIFRFEAHDFNCSELDDGDYEKLEFLKDKVDDLIYSDGVLQLKLIFIHNESNSVSCQYLKDSFVVDVYEAKLIIYCEKIDGLHQRRNDITSADRIYLTEHEFLWNEALLMFVW